MSKLGRSHKMGKKNTEYRISMTVIRDWLGFFFTIAGFWLSLTGTIHIDIQFQYIHCNIVSEIHSCARHEKAGYLEWGEYSDKELSEDKSKRKPWKEWDCRDRVGYIQENHKRGNKHKRKK